MTMRAEEIREWEAKYPDAVVLLVRDYKSMQYAVITVPQANIEAAAAEGRRFPLEHGAEIELHANGEVCVVSPFAQGPASWAVNDGR